MLKTKFPKLTEKISTKIGKTFSKIPLPPNAWTLLALIPAILGFLALVYKQMFSGFVLFLIAGFFDAVDGGVARVTKSTTKLGGYLDGIIDRIIEGFLLTGLILFDLPDFVVFGYSTPAYLWIALLLFVGTALVSYARAYASHKEVITNKKILKKIPGVLERTERLWLIGIGMLLFHVKPIYLTYVIVLAFILSVLTFLQRVLFVTKAGARK